MAGLTPEGFTPLTHKEIKDDIESRLQILNPGFDFSAESPDGQLIGIMSALVSRAWTELDKVYHSYNPNVATGQGLRNIGMITGTYKGAASRSSAIINLLGTTGALVPKGSIVTDTDGNEYYTNKDAYIPTEVSVLAVNSGNIPIPAGSISIIKSVVPGWNSILQANDGTVGSEPQSETEYRNFRNRTVMHGSRTVQESVYSEILKTGVVQVTVINNDTASPYPDGTPPNAIHVVVGDVLGVTDLEIATAIANSKGLGVITFGSITIPVNDIHGYPHDISFTKSTQVDIYVKVVIKYYAENTSGLDELVNKAISDHINALTSGQDVLISRLYGEITQFGEADVELLEIGLSAGAVAASNIIISPTEVAINSIVNIDFTSTIT